MSVLSHHPRMVATYRPEQLSTKSIAGALLRGHLLAVGEIELLIESIGLTTLEAYVLRIITSNANITIADLRVRTAIPASTLTGILTRLETRELVRRFRHVDDRRFVLVQPTTVAGTYHDIIDAAFREFDGRIRSIARLDDVAYFFAVIDAIEIRRRSSRWWG